MAGPDNPSQNSNVPTTAPSEPTEPKVDTVMVDAALNTLDQAIHNLASLVPQGGLAMKGDNLKTVATHTIIGQISPPDGATQQDIGRFQAVQKALQQEIPEIESDMKSADMRYANLREALGYDQLQQSLGKGQGLHGDVPLQTKILDVFLADKALAEAEPAMEAALAKGQGNLVLEAANEFVANPDVRRGVEYNAPHLSAHLMANLAMAEVDARHPGLSNDARVANAQTQIDTMFGADAARFPDIITEAKTDAAIPTQSNAQLTSQGVHTKGR
jgi:hypothetical protein